MIASGDFQIAFFTDLPPLLILNFIFQIQPQNNLPRFIFLVIYLYCMAIEIFIPCYYGSILTQNSNELCVRIYKSNWTDQSKRFKVAMNFFVHCSQQPIYLHTYKRLFFIQLQTFVTVKIIHEK